MSRLGSDDLLITITDSQYTELATLVYQRYGVHLTDKKVSLVRGRLNKVIRDKGLSGFGDYLVFLKQDTTGQALVELMDKLTTNHTYFYRESHHFEYFRDVCLPAFQKMYPYGDEVRIWSAGCSSGEEPYTLAMVIREALGDEASRYKILATDLSLTVLKAAQEGIYPVERLTHLPPLWRQKYFTVHDRDEFAVSQALRKMITFKRLNLMDRTFPFQKRFASIFCRNVMIYFDKDTKDDLVARLAKEMEPGGWFFVGHSESLGREQKHFRYVEPSVYIRLDHG